MQHRAGRGSLLGIEQTDGECEREEGREIGGKQLAAAIRVPSHVVRNVTDLSISFKDEKEEENKSGASIASYILRNPQSLWSKNIARAPTTVRAALAKKHGARGRTYRTRRRRSRCKHIAFSHFFAAPQRR